MKNIIPIYYTEYNRGAIRYQALPYYIDCLKPVHRRILLGTYEIARNKFTKSAKVVGHVIGNYHFHGDLPVYQAMVGLVQQRFIDGQGNWGSPGIIEDNPPAAYRYTECKLADWVNEIAFKYIKYVPWGTWEYHAVEPLYLPCPIPIGLVGCGIMEGIALYTSYMPKFSLKFLLERLKSLLNNKIINYNNIIYNCEPGCSVITADNEDIFTKGIGKITILPDIEINKKEKYIDILGKPYKKTYNKLLNDIQNNKWSIEVKDLCDKNFRMRLIITTKLLNSKFNGNITNFAKFIAKNYLLKTHNIKVNICNEDGKVSQYGIDKLILISYNYWVEAVKNKFKEDFIIATNKLFDGHVISLVRHILMNNKNVKSVKEIVDIYNKKYKNVAFCEILNENNEKEIKKIIENDIINTCKKYNIEKLIEADININELIKTQQKTLNNIKNVESICYDEITNYTKSL